MVEKSRSFSGARGLRAGKPLTRLNTRLGGVTYA